MGRSGEPAESQPGPSDDQSTTPAKEEEEGEEEEEYVVERIIRSKGKGKKKLYYVKWEGYDKEEDNTWEPADNLHHELVASARVLELGCGAGLPSLLCDKLGAASVLALDCNEEVVSRLNDSFRLSGCSAGASARTLGRQRVVRFTCIRWSAIVRRRSIPCRRRDCV